MEHKQFAKELEKRTRRFAVSCLHFLRQLVESKNNEYELHILLILAHFRHFTL